MSAAAAAACFISSSCCRLWLQQRKRRSLLHAAAVAFACPRSACCSGFRSRQRCHSFSFSAAAAPLACCFCPAFVSAVALDFGCISSCRPPHWQQLSPLRSAAAVSSVSISSSSSATSFATCSSRSWCQLQQCRPSISAASALVMVSDSSGFRVCLQSAAAVVLAGSNSSPNPRYGCQPHKHAPYESLSW